MTSKAEKHQRIIHSCLELVDLYGLHGVSISMIAKHSKVSRGWIYKYIDKNNKGVLTFSLKAYIAEFSRLSDISRYQKKEELIESLYSFSLQMMRNVRTQPVVMSLYFSHASADNVIGEMIREAERAYVNVLCQNISTCASLSLEEAQMKAELFHSMRMGALLLYLNKLKYSKDNSWELEFFSTFKAQINALIAAM